MTRLLVFLVVLTMTGCDVLLSRDAARATHTVVVKCTSDPDVCEVYDELVIPTTRGDDRATTKGSD